jgi:hypothetical protein
MKAENEGGIDNPLGFFVHGQLSKLEESADLWRLTGGSGLSQGKGSNPGGKIQPLLKRIRDLLSELDWFSCAHIYRELNQ